MNFDSTFRCYYRPLCLYAMHYLNGNIDTAEDIVQECFVRFYQHIDTENEVPGHAKPFLYTSVRNACIDFLRRRNPIITDIEPADLEGIITDSEAQERSLHEAELWTAIDNLPPRCREIFLMNKRDGMKYREIAARLGLSERTIEHQVGKALRKLRGCSDDFFYLWMVIS